jgi:hypothetical protein
MLIEKQKVDVCKLRVTRVNSTNVLDEGLRIRGRGRQMNSKVKSSQTRRVSRIYLGMGSLAR